MNKGKISLIAPARAISFGTDRKSIVLNNGRILKTDAVVLATGFRSSWNNIFDRMSIVPIELPSLTPRDINAAATKDALGLGKHAPTVTPEPQNHKWNYISLSNPPPAYPESQQWASSLYRGLVPAKNILHRDFAVNGATVRILVP